MRSPLAPVRDSHACSDECWLELAGVSPVRAMRDDGREWNMSEIEQGGTEKVQKSVFIGGNLVVHYRDVAFIRCRDIGSGCIEIYGRPGSGLPCIGGPGAEFLELWGYGEMKRFQEEFIAYKVATGNVGY